MQLCPTCARHVFPDATLREVIEQDRPLMNLYAYRPAEPHGVDIDGLMRAAMEDEPSPYDSHPRPADRIAWVQLIQPSQLSVVASEPPVDAETDSWALFADREQVEGR